MLGALGPVADEVDDGVAGVVGNPGSGQSSPSSFFSWICSSMSSATTSFLRWSLCSQRGDRSGPWRSPGASAFVRSKAAAAVLEELLLPAVEEGAARPCSSQRSETGIFSRRWRRRMATFCSGVK